MAILETTRSIPLIRSAKDTTRLRLKPNAHGTKANRTCLPVVVATLCLLVFLLCTASACKSLFAPTARKTDEAARKKNAKQAQAESADDSSEAKVIARLEDAAIDESSGIVASRRNPDLFWTHNDSGDDPLLFAFDREGKRRGVWRVEGAKARDWEDIAIGPGPLRNQPYIYVGDIGNNQNARDVVIVYRFPEPAIEPGDAESSRRNPIRTETADAIRIQYPDGAHDAEALMVHPSTGEIYVATKTTAPSTIIYKLGATPSTVQVNTLVRVGEVRIPSPFGALITGGDISPDGQRVVLCNYLSAYELQLPAASKGGFDAIWKQPVTEISLGLRQQGEAVCYRLDGAAILATSEGRNAPLIEVELRPAATKSASE
jgi:Na+-transporting methylmalonyl-CoA/oxaloacetate decarboxylase gamma subunit